MTDKLLEEIRKRIQDREVGTNGACTHIYIDSEEADSGDIMFLIEQLVKNVEDSLVQEFEDCISEELLIDVEKFLDLKDRVESKWD